MERSRPTCRCPLPSCIPRWYRDEVRRWFTASLLAFAMVAGWVSPRALTFVCAMDGLARAECCCKREDDRVARSHPRIERPGCCDVRSDRAVVATAAPHGSEHALVGADISLAPSFAWSPNDRVRRTVEHAPRGPPPGVGPPPYLRHLVLLT